MNEPTRQYLRGYEEGLTEAWREIKKLVARYTGHELSLIANSKLATRRSGERRRR